MSRWIIQRRQLATGQRAMIGERLATMERGDNQHTKNLVTKHDAAELVDVSHDSIRKAKKIRKHGAPEVVQAVAVIR